MRRPRRRWPPASTPGRPLSPPCHDRALQLERTQRSVEAGTSSGETPPSPMSQYPGCRHSGRVPGHGHHHRVEPCPRERVEARRRRTRSRPGRRRPGALPPPSRYPAAPAASTGTKRTKPHSIAPSAVATAERRTRRMDLTRRITGLWNRCARRHATRSPLRRERSWTAGRVPLRPPRSGGRSTGTSLPATSLMDGQGGRGRADALGQSPERDPARRSPGSPAEQPRKVGASPTGGLDAPGGGMGPREPPRNCGHGPVKDVMQSGKVVVPLLRVVFSLG